MMEIIAVKINSHYDGWQLIDGYKNMTDIRARNFFAGLVTLCFGYLAFSFWFNQYAMISVDEFWFAHRIYQYKDGLPYRDFSPYKTVLGYYLLLWPMTSTGGTLNTLIFTKNMIALINVACIFAASTWLTRFFSRAGVLGSVALLVSMEITLSYSTNIRVDLLAYWFCMFSLLSLLDKRYYLAGLLLGLGFSTSQKAIWYLFASNAALFVTLLTEKDYRKNIINGIKFNTATGVTIAAYLVFWSMLAGWSNVLNNVFIEAAAMYHLDWYDATRQLYWYVILVFNPIVFLLWPLTALSLLIGINGDESTQNRKIVITYASTILFCLIPYKQVFPYYMQVTIPVFLVLYAGFFTWLIKFLDNRNQIYFTINKQTAYATLGGYVAASIVFVAAMHLPLAYLLINIIPLVITMRMTQQTPSDMRALVASSMIFLGLIYPACLYIPKLMNLDGNYQKANLAAVNSLLRDGSDYTAGIELIYNKTQPIAGLRHLMGPAIDYLYHPDKKLLPVMTAALYEDPHATPDTIKQALDQSRVKFYVNNYRMNGLPPSIKSYLTQNYQHLWGSIYSYAPIVPAGINVFPLKFTGDYIVESTSPTIMINGKNYRNGEHVQLGNSRLRTRAAQSFRLKLVDTSLFLDPAYQEDEWGKIIF
jgi:hypothetical protein